MKDRRFFSFVLCCALLVISSLFAKDEIEFMAVDDAVAAGWSANNGGVLMVTYGCRSDSRALQATGCQEWGGLTCRSTSGLDLTGVEKISVKLRQNIHNSFNFYMNIEVIQPSGTPRTITKVLPGGVGWNQWEQVTMDLRDDKLEGRLSIVTFYSDAFKENKDFFLAADDLEWTFASHSEEQCVISIPRLSAAPVIDGQLAEGEWQQASELTGFALLSGKLSSRQARVWFGHDDKNLYVAFAGQFESPGSPDMGKAGKLAVGDLASTDLFELWLATPKIHQQFVVNMNHGVYQHDYLQNADSDINLVYKTSIKTNGFLTGGDWYGEMAVPLAELPGFEEGLQLLCTRDYYNASGRSDSDWTSLKPMPGGFAACDQYFRAILADRPQFVQLDNFGDLTGGEVKLVGAIGNAPEELQLSWQIFSESGPRLGSFTGKAGNGRFTIGERLKLKDKEDVRGIFQVIQPADGQIIYSQELEFSCGSPLHFQCIPHPGTGEVTVRFDTRSLAWLPADSEAVIQIFDGEDEVRQEHFALEAEPKTYEFDLKVSELAEKAYRISCSLHSEGQVFQQSALPEVWLGIPEWVNAVVIPDEIPSPWIPLQAEGTKINLLGREYQLGGNGFPAVISSIEKELLAAPTVLTVQVGGKAEELRFAQPQLTENRPDKVVYALSGESDSLRCQGMVTIDFDGVARWRMQFTAKRKLVLDELALNWTMAGDRAVYARANRIGGNPAGYAAILNGNRQPKTGQYANTWLSEHGWIWPEPFFYQFMVGDDDSGISMFTETEQYHRGNTHLSIWNENNNRLVQVMLTSGHQLQAGETISYDYGWVGLPLKPASRNPQDYHQGIGSAFEADRPLLESGEDMFHDIPIMVGARYTRHDSYWQLEETDPAKRLPRNPGMDKTDFVEGLKKAARNGCQVVCDGIYFSAADTGAPESKRYIEDWKILPGGYSWINFLGNLDLASCTNSSWKDFMLTVSARLLDNTPLGGVYLDVSTESACDNALHGCGYTDENGKRHQTINVWSMRDLHKKVYTYYHTGGRNGRMFHHYLNCAAWAGFCDAGFQGEDWCVEPERYKVMTPEVFRAMKMTQYGTPYTFFAIFIYWQDMDMSEVMSVCLPHHVFPAVWAYRKENYLAVKPYWAILDDWWCAADFVSYWSEEPPTDANSDARILASALVKPDKAMLLVSNWNETEQEIQLQLNAKCFPFKVRQARNAMTQEMLSVSADGLLTVKIPARYPLMIEIGETL